MDEEANIEPDSAPPKQSPFKTISSGNGAPQGGAPKTIVLRRPALRRPDEAPAPAPEGIVQPVSEATKKLTSRINLSDGIQKPQEPAPSAGGAAPAQNPKKVTSRITLESAFSAESPLPSAPQQPKTIKLKRPVDISPAPVPASPVTELPPAPADEFPSPPLPDSAQVTKKTIKVKRPSAGGARISLNRNAVGDDSEVSNLQNLSRFDPVSNQGAASDDGAHPAFIAAAIANLAVLLWLCWTLASQAFGRNSALGDYASAKGPDVPPPPGCARYF